MADVAVKLQNVKVSKEGNEIVIRIDVTKSAYDTTKSTVVGTTGGWEPLAAFGHPDLALNLNCIKKFGGKPWKVLGGVA